jgi:hypothetical protein
LQAIAREGKLTAIVAAGDLCLGGSDPAGCVDMLRAAGVVGVYGNTELYVLHPEQTPADELHRSQWETIQPVAYWVRDRLLDEQLAWLEALPFERRFSPTGISSDDLLVVHANPKDVELMLYPPPEGQQRLWGQVRQPDDDPDLVSVLENVSAGVVAFGHFHTHFQRSWRGLCLVGVACCSMPGIDRDLRARYTMLSWERGGWQVCQRWVDYDVRQEIEALRASDMPFKESFLKYYD